MPNDPNAGNAQVISVSELNQTVARLLERSIPLCWISGEISNFTRAASGHWYFTLKDAQAQVRAVMFKSRTLAVEFMPREGEKVEVRATVSLYAPRGDFQINVEAVRRAGQGNLYEAFLRLKHKLTEAGLFDPTRKQPLPASVRTVGIITSPQAAALRDILTSLARRAPHIRAIVYPTPVQGAGAAEKIAAAIQLAASRDECDVLILARGGGSIEDLWAFNDEQLAYTIARCPIPLVAGIGHETDFTIADFVADLRAATPTAAAELAVPARADLLAGIGTLSRQLTRAMQRRFEQNSQMLDGLTRRLISPLAYLEGERARLRAQQMVMARCQQAVLTGSRLRFEQLKHRLLAVRPDSGQPRTRLNQLMRELQSRNLHALALYRQTLASHSAQLEMLNPQRTLERGYAIIRDGEGQLIQRADQFTAPARLLVRVADGQRELEISQVNPKP